MAVDKKENSPRPDFYREDRMYLNGEWNFEFDDEERGFKEKWYEKHEYSSTIQVPFCYQSTLSGIESKQKHFHLWYEREVVLSEEWKNKNIWLHFGAVDYEAIVWINGQYAGSHKGGFSSHSYDMTPYIDWKSQAVTITVYCKDDDSIRKPRGKQHWNEQTDRCWYTATSGIWQNVWLEATNGYRIENMKITPDIDLKTVCIDFRFSKKPDNGNLVWKLTYQGREKKRGTLSIHSEKETLLISVINEDPIDNKIHLWEPERPNLYDIEFEVYEDDILQDKVETYFGMRKIERKGEHIYLNHYPLYQKLILDQGYWIESLMTPPSKEALKKDLELVKEMGFNGIRKHQKIEDPRFLYYADTLGVLVWEEMPSFYEFCEESMQAFMQEYAEILERDYNHPSIITWVHLMRAGVFEMYFGIRDSSILQNLHINLQKPGMPQD